MKIKTRWLQRRRQVCSQAEGYTREGHGFVCRDTRPVPVGSLRGFQFICWDCAHASYSTNVQVLNNLYNLYLPLKLEMRKDLLVFCCIKGISVCQWFFSCSDQGDDLIISIEWLFQEREEINPCSLPDIHPSILL